MEKTSIGLSENLAGLLCYVLGWISRVVLKEGIAVEGAITASYPSLC